MCGYFVSGNVGQAKTSELQLDKMHYGLSTPRDCVASNTADSAHAPVLRTGYVQDCRWRSVYSLCARHCSLQFMLGNIANEGLLLKRGDDFGLYRVFYCGYRKRV